MGLTPEQLSDHATGGLSLLLATGLVGLLFRQLWRGERNYNDQIDLARADQAAARRDAQEAQDALEAVRVRLDHCEDEHDKTRLELARLRRALIEAGIDIPQH